MKEYKPFKSGKVRELYDLGDSLVMVCTDRISAFDVILKDPVPEKGAVLNKMSKFWFDFTKDIVPNHMLSIDTKDMPEFFRTPEFEGRSMKTQKLEMLPVECVVRELSALTACNPTVSLFIRSGNPNSVDTKIFEVIHLSRQTCQVTAVECCDIFIT